MTPAEIRSRLTDNLHAVEARIAAACTRAGRKRDDVTLIAVTKYVDVDVAGVLPELGVLDLGESRPQELWRKAPALPKDIRWHMIGHLQRNKVERTLPLAHVIHSADSARLLQAIQEYAQQQERRVGVLLEVNLSGEESKHGMRPDEIWLFQVGFAYEFDNIDIRGLMTMAALSPSPADSRPVFAELRRLRDKMRQVYREYGEMITELSMGMTNDFEVAVEEGATMVRIGSALFDGLMPAH